MKNDEYKSFDALGLADLVQKKEISPLELIDCAESIYAAENPKINAVVLSLFDHARETLSKNKPTGIFAGVPFLLKDLGADLKGTVTSEGSRSCVHQVADSDSRLVTAYKNSGVSIVGKTNTAEFGTSWVTEPELFGPCRNPFDLKRTAGGSSGGAAAAVAAGIAPMAHASDAGGSIRVPAGCCGLFGFKPSRGLLPERKSNWSGLSVAHVITKSVRDSAAMLAIEANKDPHYFLNALKEPPQKLKIAMSLGIGVDVECVKAVMHAKALCESLGHTVVDDAPKYDSEKMWRARLLIVERAMFQSLQSVPKELVERFNWDFAMGGKHHSEDDVVRALEVLKSESIKANEFFKSQDLFLTPTTAMVSPKIGAFVYTGDDPVSYIYNMGQQFAPFSSLANNTGCPAMSLPLYKTEEGLPVAVQFMGRVGEDLMLLDLADALQKWGC